MLERFRAELTQTRTQIWVLVLFSIVPSLCMFALHWHELNIVGRHWDGPNYIEVAKTAYFIPENNPFLEKYHSQPIYYACHLPLFPLLIRIFAWMTYPVSMMFVTLATAALATVAFYQLLKEYKCVADPFFTAWLGTFLPIRYVLCKSTGSTEPLYILLVFLSLIAYKRDKVLLAFVLAGLSGITRITGILMAAGYFCDLIYTKRYRYIPWLTLIGLPILATFAFYAWRFGDFLAYFHWNGSMLRKTPFKQFKAYTVSDLSIAAEFYYYQYAFYAAGTACIWRWKPLFFYCATYYLFAIHIFHNDVSRYLIPIVYLAVFVGFDDLIKRKTWRWTLPVLFYLSMYYANRSLGFNLAPEESWQQLLRQPSWP